jgi:chitin-binding protein
MRKVAAGAAVTILAAGAGLLVSVISPSPAAAHGATVFPGSRQYFCWVDGLQENGQIIPANPACADAVAASGTTPLYNWFANLHPAAAGQTAGFIPDGRICDGTDAGPFDFSPYNAMRPDWPRTHLTAGDTYTFRHNNWAAHPGRFDVYLTVQGWNPAAPLAWSSLEQVHTAVNPPQTGGPGGLENYLFDVTFPADRSGQHLVFTHWVRSDSPENFFSCADIVFDGGDGEVSGIGGDPGPIDPPDPPATSTVLTGLTPGTHYEIAVRARNSNTGAVSALSQPAPFDTPDEGDPPVPGDCTVDYRVISQWNPGFHVELTVTNDSGSTINGWEVGWLWADGQQVTQLWSGIGSQVGAAVSVTNESWNPTLPANGGSVIFGFLGTWSGANSAPAAFTLNGASCTVS